MERYCLEQKALLGRLDLIWYSDRHDRIWFIWSTQVMQRGIHFGPLKLCREGFILLNKISLLCIISQAFTRCFTLFIYFFDRDHTESHHWKCEAFQIFTWWPNIFSYSLFHCGLDTLESCLWIISINPLIIIFTLKWIHFCFLVVSDLFFRFIYM